jgi:AbrB family looped-hinge helix DNA binding protein
MGTVKVSPKFQVVITKNVRNAMGLKPGEILQIGLLHDSLVLRRIRPISELRGIAKGMKWKDDYREH